MGTQISLGNTMGQHNLCGLQVWVSWVQVQVGCLVTSHQSLVTHNKPVPVMCDVDAAGFHRFTIICQPLPHICCLSVFAIFLHWLHFPCLVVSLGLALQQVSVCDIQDMPPHFIVSSLPSEPSLHFIYPVPVCCCPYLVYLL
jgi:hypothetical protein